VQTSWLTLPWVVHCDVLDLWTGRQGSAHLTLLLTSDVLYRSTANGWCLNGRCGVLSCVVWQAPWTARPGSHASSFDVTGKRLVTCEADKTIKMWKEDENATPETHPSTSGRPRT